MTPLSWYKLSRIPNGTKLTFVKNWNGVVTAGTSATVEENGLNEIYQTMIVRVDNLPIYLIAPPGFGGLSPVVLCTEIMT